MVYLQIAADLILSVPCIVGMIMAYCAAKRSRHKSGYIGSAICAGIFILLIIDAVMLFAGQIGIIDMI